MTERATNILGWMVFAAIMAGIWLLFGEGTDTSDIGRNQPLIADRSLNLDDIHEIQIAAASNVLTMQRSDDGWLTADGTKLNADKVSSLMNGVINSIRREPKVGNTLRSEREDLGDSEPLFVSLLGSDGEQIFSMTTGFYIKAAEGAGLTYVLVSGEEKAWLVTSLPPLSANEEDWQ